jgi:uridylate kinase
MPLKIVIKIGGFLFPERLDLDMINGYVKLLRKLFSNGHELVVVTGGGIGSREYIELSRKIGSSEAICDELGIEFSRLNARLLLSGLQEAFPEIPTSLREVKRYFEINKLIVMGGLQPGQSTNAVAALAFEIIRADILINATDVEGIYSEDPRKNPKAKKFDKISIEDLSRIISSEKAIAGSYDLLDILAVKIIARSKIPTWVLDGRNPKNIDRIINGGHIGTKIISS